MGQHIADGLADGLAERTAAGLRLGSEAPDTVARLDAVIELLTAIRDQPGAPSQTTQNEPGNSLGTQFPAASQPSQPAPLPSKRALAEAWFADHPEDLERSGRDLEQHVKPQGVTISYKYWNKVKRAFH